MHLVGGELAGGAARGAYWLHKGLLGLGVDSRVLTNSRETYSDETVTSIATNKKRKVLALARNQADSSLRSMYRRRQQLIFSTGFFGHDFTRARSYAEADIVHLHWICGGMVNTSHLAKVDKPLIWTMRDMWPMTGGCHYSMDCEAYKSGCGKCPQLRSKRSKDLSRFVLRRKGRYVPKTTRLVGISHWLSDCARSSTLFRDHDVRTIHNNVSTQEFFPVEKSVARQVLNLPQERSIVLTGAQSIDSFYKGFDIYLGAVPGLESDPLLLFFGKLDPLAVEPLGRDYVNLGFLHDTVSLRLAYSAADVFVAPSRMEAFGKTLAEAMACGTPVVCFDATGPRDIVSHEVDGYRAQPFDATDLAKGIRWTLEDHERREWLSRNARRKAEQHFDVCVIAGQYRELYEEAFHSAKQI